MNDPTIERTGGERIPGILRILVLVGALLIIAAGLVGSGLGILVGLLDQGGDTLPIITFSVSFLILALCLGTALAWQSWSSMQGRESNHFQVKRIRFGVLGYLLSILAGQLILSSGLLPALFFPPFHVAAAALPPLIILALAARGLGGSARWRGVTLQLGSGAFLSTSLAFALEFAVIFALLVSVGVALAMQPGSPEMIQALYERLQDPAWLQDPTALAPLARFPLVWAAALLILSGIVPLLEEGVKTIGVTLLAYQRPGLSQFYLWGLASGAGFALAESLFNSASGLDAWAFLAFLRVGASLLHCFTGGLMGLAWYQLLVHRRWGRGLGIYVAAVGIHALWNALATAMALLPMSSLGGGAAGVDDALANLGSLAILGLLVVLALAVGLGLLVTTRYVRRRSQTAAAVMVAGEPALSLSGQPPSHLAAGGDGQAAVPVGQPDLGPDRWIEEE